MLKLTLEGALLLILVIFAILWALLLILKSYFLLIVLIAIGIYAYRRYREDNGKQTKHCDSCNRVKSSK